MALKKVNLKWTPFALGCLDEIYEHIAFKEKSDRPASKLRMFSIQVRIQSK
jgi:hypothetical protein